MNKLKHIKELSMCLLCSLTILGCATLPETRDIAFIEKKESLIFSWNIYYDFRDKYASAQGPEHMAYDTAIQSFIDIAEPMAAELAKGSQARKLEVQQAVTNLVRERGTSTAERPVLLIIFGDKVAQQLINKYPPRLNLEIGN